MILNTNHRKVLALILLPFVIAGVVFIHNKNKTNEIYAVDPLIVTYSGGPPPNPMFNINNMLPGDIVQKDFNVKNDSPNPVNVEMTAVKTGEEKAFAGILDIEIGEIDTLTPIFIGKLQEFFDHPPFNLGEFAPGTDKSFRVKVRFPSSAGNEYQNARVVFNIYWRTQLPPIELPPECEHLRGEIVNVIEGTPAHDRIFGTSHGDLIIGKDGNDYIEGVGGSDCIVGGEGNDHIEGDSGQDTILGGGGNDRLIGGAGNDTIFGEAGNDNLDGGSGDDVLWGGIGNDDLVGAAGNDKLHAGPGNDTLRGESGEDELFGEEGNDNLHGGAADDFLDGGADTDTLHGDSGTDTCVNGESQSSCEL